MSEVTASDAIASEPLRLLTREGEITLLDPESVRVLKRVDGETDPLDLASVDLSAGTLVVEFNGAADGRGYSLVKALRDVDFTGQLYASGHLNPDQLSMALQTGFDGVLVTPERWADYGEASWNSALTPIVSLSYAITNSVHHRSIWQSRHGS